MGVHTPSAGAAHEPARSAGPRWPRRLVAAAAGGAVVVVAALVAAGGAAGHRQPASLARVGKLRAGGGGGSTQPAEDRGLRDVVTMLAAEVMAPGVCDKRALIMDKLEALLTRLGARATELSATDAQYQKEAETALHVWLEVETIYRTSQEKFDEETQASELILQQLEVAQRVEALTQKSVQQVIAEYPGKKAEVSEEKAMVLELISMVDKLSFSSMAAAQSPRAAEQRLRSLRAEALAAAGTASKAATRSLPRVEFAKLRLLKAQLARMEGGGSGHGTPEQRGRAGTTFEALPLGMNGSPENAAGGVTKEDVEVTKSAILKILYDLLKDPDFREHLIEQGLQAAHARLDADKAKVQELQKEEVKLAAEADKAKEEAAVAGMDRNEDAGHKLAKEKAYVSEHKEYISQNSSNDKGVFVIKTIINKINEYCDKEGGAQPDDASSAQQKAAVMPLLAAAQAAAEAAWRTGGER